MKNPSDHHSRRPSVLIPAPDLQREEEAAPGESRRDFLRKTGTAAIYSAIGYTVLQNTAEGGLVCHASEESRCPHMISTQTSGFALSYYSETSWASSDGYYVKGVFQCNPGYGYGKSVHIDFWAEGWIDGQSSTHSTQSFQTYAKIPFPHGSGWTKYLPVEVDYVELSSSSHISHVDFPIPGSGLIYHTEYYTVNVTYNAYIQCYATDIDGTDDSVQLEGKVYIKKNVTGKKPKLWDPVTGHVETEDLDVPEYTENPVFFTITFSQS
ncbi:MAG: hypothetical protein EOP88_06385 [Verrucomicrobiaceae bacterium]|nr:MAG: hypothetical protein EOP88_06385 [Verrucomicrobiaceae bacterium]